MFARSEFGNDSAKTLMSSNLRGNHGRDDLAPITHERGRSLIAGSFDTEYQHGQLLVVSSQLLTIASRIFLCNSVVLSVSVVRPGAKAFTTEARRFTEVTHRVVVSRYCTATFHFLFKNPDPNRPPLPFVSLPIPPP